MSPILDISGQVLSPSTWIAFQGTFSTHGRIFRSQKQKNHSCSPKHNSTLNLTVFPCGGTCLPSICEWGQQKTWSTRWCSFWGVNILQKIAFFLWFWSCGRPCSWWFWAILVSFILIYHIFTCLYLNLYPFHLLCQVEHSLKQNLQIFRRIILKLSVYFLKHPKTQFFCHQTCIQLLHPYPQLIPFTEISMEKYLILQQ